MSIQPTTPCKKNFSTPALDDKTSSMPTPFVRAVKGNTFSNEVRAGSNATHMPPALGPMGKWRSRVFRACEELDLKPGEQKILIIRKDSEPGGHVIEKPMVLRHTNAGDAYVFQTPEDSVHRPFQGLHLKGDAQMRYNMETIPLVPNNPNDHEANQQFLDLSRALDVVSDGPGY